MANKPNWRGSAPRSSSGSAKGGTGPKRSGGKQKFFLLAAMLGMIGALAAIITFFKTPPEAAFLSIAITEYDNPSSYPPNPWGQQDSNALASLNWSQAVPAFAAQERTIFLQKVHELVDRANPSDFKQNRPIVVSISSLAVARGKKVYLLPGLADPSDESTWLPLSEVLDVLNRAQSPRLLLLDVAHPVADARLGILSDEASTALDDELTAMDDAKTLKFLVLTSCGKKERSHASLELRRSVFSYFVEMGLLGNADGWGDSKKTNQKIEALELANYVRTQVSHWAKNNDLPSQTPRIYGNKTDFVVFSPQKPYPTPSLPPAPEAQAAKPAEKDKPAEPPPTTYPQWLKEGFAERDAWLTDGRFRPNSSKSAPPAPGDRDAPAPDGSYRRMPRTFRHLEEILMRAERRWLAGDDEANVKRGLNDEMKKLRELRKGYLPKDYETVSLAEAHSLGIKDETKIAADLSILLKLMSSHPAPNDAALTEGLAKFLKLDPVPSDALAHAALERLRKDGLDPDDARSDAQLVVFDSFFKKVLFLRPTPNPADILLVSFLVNLDSERKGRWQDDNLKVKSLILQTGAAAEEASAIDPRALPWVEKNLKAAYDLRIHALFDLAGLAEATERQTAKENLEKVLAKFDQIVRDAKTLEGAFRRTDEAMVLLPALVAPLGARPNEKGVWMAIYPIVKKLLNLIYGSPSGEALAEIGTLSQDLNSRIGEFRGRYSNDNLDALLTNSATAEPLLRQLDFPFWNAGQRIRIYDKAVALGQDQAAKAIAKAIQLKPEATMPSASGTNTDDPEWRARLAIDLLKLDGEPKSETKVESLDEKLTQAAGSPSAAAWEKLGADIRKEWTATLVSSFKDEKKPMIDRQRIGFVLHPFDMKAIPLPPEPFERDPAAILRNEEAQTLWQWLAKNHYEADANVIRKNKRKEMTEYGNDLEQIARALKAR